MRSGLLCRNKGLKLRIEVNSVGFVAPAMAIEDGITSA